MRFLQETIVSSESAQRYRVPDFCRQNDEAEADNWSLIKIGVGVAYDSCQVNVTDRFRSRKLKTNKQTKKKKPLGFDEPMGNEIMKSLLFACLLTFLVLQVSSFQRKEIKKKKRIHLNGSGLRPRSNRSCVGQHQECRLWFFLHQFNSHHIKHGRKPNVRSSGVFVEWRIH